MLKEVGNQIIISSCLDILHSLFISDDLDDKFCLNFEQYGIYRALMAITKVYINDQGIIHDVLWIIEKLIYKLIMKCMMIGKKN
jgi:hypothetical protein